MLMLVELFMRASIDYTAPWPVVHNTKLTVKSQVGTVWAEGANQVGQWGPPIIPVIVDGL